MIDFAKVTKLEIPEGIVTKIVNASGLVLWNAVKMANLTITSFWDGMDGDTARITITSPSPFAPNPNEPNNKVTSWTAYVYDLFDQQNRTIKIPVGSTIECYITRDKGNADSYIKLNDVNVATGEGTYIYTVTGDATIDVSEDYIQGDFGVISIVGAVTYISFSINGETYQAIEGMNWNAWFASSYNTTGKAKGDANSIKDANGNEVSLDSVIISGTVYEVEFGGKAVLMVEKITSDTYAGETTYTGEQFILLNVYPKKNGKVKVTYGGLTKTITDTSGAEEPNAQQVFFGTFNGVTDSVATPASGELTVSGDVYSFSTGGYRNSSTAKMDAKAPCILNVKSLGVITKIYMTGILIEDYQKSLVIPDTVTEIGLAGIAFRGGVGEIVFEGRPMISSSAFTLQTSERTTVKVLATTPPEMILNSDGKSNAFGDPENTSFVLEKIIVPKGCSNTYKTAVGWSQYSNYIVEAS